jgi:hypothetical protein
MDTAKKNSSRSDKNWIFLITKKKNRILCHLAASTMQKKSSDVHATVAEGAQAL